MQLIKKLFGKIGIDGAIAFTILTRIIQASGGIVSIFFIARYLSPKEQGYYYTFSSILAIQIFFELGLSGIITQYTAHEFAHLEWNGLELIGEEYYKSRLSSLLMFCAKWFAVIAVVLFFALVAAGYYFFNNFNTNDHIDWQYPWVILCLTTSLNLFIDPILAFFDGLSEVKDMAKVRLVQKIVNVILMFVFFALGFKLYSAALASLMAICCNYMQIFFSKRIKYLAIIWRAKGEWILNYYYEIFPFQWRIAISWISGYFIFQLFNPVLFATEGAIVAGQMGMTIAALTGVASISMSWVSTKVPLFSTFIAKKDYLSLDHAFKQTIKYAIGINGICIFILICFVQLSKHYHLMIGNRFLSFIPFVCMCLASILNQAIFAIATYLRCHKKEPMLLQSIIMGILVCLSTIIFGNKFGVLGITVSYFILTCFVGTLWTILIFFTKKREWHIE